jgi:hypothetical protein
MWPFWRHICTSWSQGRVWRPVDLNIHDRALMNSFRMLLDVLQSVWCARGQLEIVTNGLIWPFWRHICTSWSQGRVWRLVDLNIYDRALMNSVRVLLDVLQSVWCARGQLEAVTIGLMWPFWRHICTSWSQGRVWRPVDLNVHDRTLRNCSRVLLDVLYGVCCALTVWFALQMSPNPHKTGLGTAVYAILALFRLYLSARV